MLSMLVSTLCMIVLYKLFAILFIDIFQSVFAAPSNRIIGSLKDLNESASRPALINAGVGGNINILNGNNNGDFTGNIIGNGDGSYL